MNSYKIEKIYGAAIYLLKQGGAVGANSYVDKDVDEHTIVAGLSAKAVC
jgi:hypothetical protein